MKKLFPVKNAIVAYDVLLLTELVSHELPNQGGTE